MSIGEIIKSARTAKGMTQTELAEKVGVKKSAVAKWENGRVTEIGRTNLKRLSEVLGIDPNRLLGNDITPMFEEKEPITATDGFTAKQMELMDFVKTVPEEKAEMILRVIQSIVESD